jgi:hypothetical protein
LHHFFTSELLLPACLPVFKSLPSSLYLHPNFIPCLLFYMTASLPPSSGCLSAYVFLPACLAFLSFASLLLSPSFNFALP